MVGCYSGPPKEISSPNSSDHISITWPDEYISVDPKDQVASSSSENLSQGESNKADSQGQIERILSHPQVTVNVFNTGSNSGGFGGSGASDATTINSNPVSDRNDTVSILSSQLENLSKDVQRLSLLAAQRRPIVESGAWNTADVRPWDKPMESTTGRVNFLNQFKSVPTVMVSLNSADVSKAANFRVRVYATTIDVKGFTIHADSWWDTTLYSCGVSWIAIGE
ncbi:hypothetical protein FHL15_007065 [Xylaria flabelliformis]|uniref:H-type lectin domain-containing protein n=1 Tax=Xylaria flabelliformis TaxID=2512241 RepID=A0A553HVL1_9PEZI|nr:hypothetical protein FHL15_007065 [Xylaria flabelliformis]